MLIELNIHNIALIESLRIDFAEGFNVLTGETGSGKSIIVDCMNLVLGGRADRGLVRTGAEKGYVQALFDIAGREATRALCLENGIELSEDALLITREVAVNGRNTCRVNGMIVPLNLLRALSATLLDIHGQHEHQALMRPGEHVRFLDAYGGDAHQALLKRCAQIHQERSALAAELKRLIASLRESERLADMLRYQVNEINGARLKPGEEEKLQEKLQLLSNAGRIHDSVARAYQLVYQGEGRSISAQEALQGAAAEMERIQSLSPRYQELTERLRELFYAVQDAGYELQDALDKLPNDPEMEEKLSNRLKIIDRLERKYGATVDEVIAFGKRAEEQLGSIETGDLQIAEMKERLKELDARLLAVCAEITDHRKALGEALREKVMAQLKDLGMGATRFEVALTPLPKPTASGMETVEFMISPNPGEPLKPLSEIASGGELSRIMLAMKAISADQEGVPSMVFDEIDTGVSGRMAQVVGEKMCAIAAGHQVLCVTHLPQIAALGTAQFLVSKSVSDGRTETNVQRLDEQGRIREISRLVGGAQDTPSSLMHARQMLEDAAQRRKQISI